ncbi:MAG: hypothetical protein AN484_26970, partial [Aphanizomenon flos-aquae WA102]
MADRGQPLAFPTEEEELKRVQAALDAGTSLLSSDEREIVEKYCAAAKLDPQEYLRTLEERLRRPPIDVVTARARVRTEVAEIDKNTPSESDGGQRQTRNRGLAVMDEMQVGCDKVKEAMDALYLALGDRKYGQEAEALIKKTADSM